MATRGLLPLAGLVAIAPCMAVTGAAAVGPSQLAVGIAGPGSAEMSAWTELRLHVQNLNAESVRVDLSVTLPTALARPGAAAGASCVGANQPPATTAVECELSLGGTVTGSVAFPVQWNGPGMRTVDATARVVSSSSTGPDATATSSVSVYMLVLRNLKTAPSPARKGRTFTATATLARSDTHEPVNAHSLRCLAGTQAVPKSRILTRLYGRGRRSGARLRCSWPVPSSAKGRFVTALMLADTRTGGMQTKYPFARSVR
jgi:hypothetical protein